MGTMQIIVGAHSLQTYMKHQMWSSPMTLNRKHGQRLGKKIIGKKMLSFLLQLTRRKLMLTAKE
jgi:hypothetical protein